MATTNLKLSWQQVKYSRRSLLGNRFTYIRKYFCTTQDPKDSIKTSTISNSGVASTKKKPKRDMSAFLNQMESMTSSKSEHSSTNLPPNLVKKKNDGSAFRHPLDWNNPDFYNEESLDKEMRRVFDVCNGCRMCFNLCNSFPKLFELVDKSPTESLHSIESEAFKPVVDSCTLCDLCFITKCPYVPPHSFNIDFPHLMLRYRIIEKRKQDGKSSLPNSGSSNKEIVPQPSFNEKLKHKIHTLYTDIDKMSIFATPLSSFVNWVTATGTTPRIVRLLLEKVVDIHHRADLPQFVSSNKTFLTQFKSLLPVNSEGPSFGKRKVLLYATCLINYNKPHIGLAASALLRHNGVDVQTEYPECCGMPQLESGDIENVTKRARNISKNLLKYVEQGYDIVALVPSCALMIKHEWPNFLPQDANIQKLASHTFDLSEYLVNISKKEGFVKGMKPLSISVTLHHACHARAQHMGFKAKELLKLIPGLQLVLVERCSGHGGSFGVKKTTHPIAMHVGKPVFEQMEKTSSEKTSKDIPVYFSSECPLAADHIKQGVSTLIKDKSDSKIQTEVHPVELLALSYGLKY